MKKVLLGLSCFLALQGYATENDVQPNEVPPKKECTHFSIWGDFLYWKGTVSNLPYAVDAKITDVVGFDFANDESLKEIRFPFDPGFRVGITGRFDTDWDLLAAYTRLHTSGHVSEKASLPKVIFLLWDLALPAMIDSLKAHQSLHFDQINLDFVKHFSIGTHFALDSFFGATGVLIHQKLNINAHQVFDPPSVGTVNSHIKNNFAGAGPEIGLQINYTPIKRFSFYGKGSYALLYGKFNLSTRSVDNITLPPLVTFVHRQSTHEFSLVSAFDVLLGLKTSWSLPRYLLTAHLDYEFLFWPGQVRVPRIRSDISSKTPLTSVNNAQGDIGFQGLTIGLSLCF